MINLSDAAPQRADGVIPDGTYARLRLEITPGGADGFETGDEKLLKIFGSGALALDCQYTVLSGPHIGRKFFNFMWVQGKDGTDKAWNATKSTIAAIARSVTGLTADDVSPAALAKLNIPNLASLHGVEFYGKVGVEQGGEFPDKNVLDRAVTADQAEYALLVRGEVPTPKPRRARKAAADAPPTWQTTAVAAPVQTPLPWSSQLPGGGGSTLQATHIVPPLQGDGRGNAHMPATVAGGLNGGSPLAPSAPTTAAVTGPVPNWLAS